MTPRLEEAVKSINEGIKAIIGQIAVAQDGLDQLMKLNLMLIELGAATPDLTQTNSPSIVVTAPNTSDRFKLSDASKNKLTRLKPEMADVVRRAIQLTAVDFSVYETARTLEQQRNYVKRGVSRTMKSKHLSQADGFAHAVDLVPYIDGKLVWDWDGCYAIACAMDEAATQLGYAGNIRWGGAWDRVLSDFGGSSAEYKLEVEKYKQRHAGSDFIDGPHFEWVA